MLQSKPNTAEKDFSPRKKIGTYIAHNNKQMA